MQKATYVISLLLKNFADWPVEAANVVFRSNKRILVSGREIVWQGPTTLENLLINLSYAPFSLQLVNPLAGKIDLFIKTASLRHSLKNESQIPLEHDLTELIRNHSARLIFSPPSEADSVTQEIVPSTIGKLNFLQRFKMSDDLYFDPFVEGFIQGSPPNTVPTLPVSVVFSPYNFFWHNGLLTSGFFDIVEKLPQQRCNALSVRLKTILVIDSEAPKCDVRILTLQVLQTLQVLRLTMEDFRSWQSSMCLEDYDGSINSLISFRKSFSVAQSNPRFTVHPAHIHWRACVWQMGSVFQGLIPSGDWCFVIDSSAVGWATCLPNNCLALRNIATRFKTEFVPEQWEQLNKNSWRLPLQKKRLMVRLLIYEMSSHERNLFRDDDPMMSSFGLLRKDTGWSAQAGLLKLLKKDSVLAADHLESCLSGFALENARELLQISKPQCVLCATNSCNTMLDACGHIFCDVCVKTFVDGGGNTCPVCRRPMEPDAWTQVRRTTTRKDVVQFSKQEQIQTLVRNLKGSICLVVPNTDCAQQVLKWCNSSCHIECPGNVHLSASKQFDHIVCCTALLPDTRTLEILHQLMQSNSTDMTTLHVLVARHKDHFASEEAHGWVRDFCKCYSNMIEMSSYS